MHQAALREAFVSPPSCPSQMIQPASINTTIPVGFSAIVTTTCLYPSGLRQLWWNFNRCLVRWSSRNSKRLSQRKTRASRFIDRVARAHHDLLIHWRLGEFPRGLNDRSRMNREVHVRFSEGPTVKLHRSTYSTEEAQDFLYFQTNTREKGFSITPSSTECRVYEYLDSCIIHNMSA